MATISTKLTMLAVGEDDKRGLIFFDWDTETWEFFDPQPDWASTTSGGARGLATAPTGEIYVGDNARDRMYHYDPATKSWTTVTWSAQGSDLLVLASDCVSNKFAVMGVADKVYFWEPDKSDQWEFTVDIGTVYDIWAYATDEVWVANATQIHRWNGVAWGDYTSLLLAAGAAGTVWSVWGLSPTEVYVGLTDNKIYRWDGAAFSEHGNIGGNVYSIWGTASNDIYAMSWQTDRLWHFNGALWQDLYLATGFRPTNGRCKRIRGLSSSHMFICCTDYVGSIAGIYSTTDSWSTWAYWEYIPPLTPGDGLYDFKTWRSPTDFSGSIEPDDQYGIQAYSVQGYGAEPEGGEGNPLCGDIDDHRERALALLPGQFEDSVNLQDLIGSFIGPPGWGSWGVQELECVLAALRDNRWPGTAEGQQIDGLGEIVGVDRMSPDDEEYTASVLVQIAINLSKGYPETLIAIAQTISAATKVHLRETPPSRVSIFLLGTAEIGNLFKLDKAAPAGVAVTVTGSENPTPFVFGVDRDAAGAAHGEPLPYGAGFGETTYTGIGGRFVEIYVP